MTKNDPTFEAVLARLGKYTRTVTKGQIDVRILDRVDELEMTLADAKLKPEYRKDADAALYRFHQALKRTNGLTRDDVLTESRTVELPIPGDSDADKQLQNIVRGFQDRRATKEAPVVQEA